MRVGPPIHIYFSALCEDIFIPFIYDICHHFIGSIYQKVFKGDAPRFSDRARALISTMGDWYVGEYFAYIRIRGSNIVHLLPRIVPYRMVLEEISFQAVVDGVFLKLTRAKRKGWPKIPLNLGPLVI